jgi:DNA-binding transcriptional ArsR family regulator
MVAYQTMPAAKVDRIFRALADATRRDIVERVLSGEQSVSGLADSYAMSFAAVQKHVAVLERAGLVSKHVHGRERLVRGKLDAIRKVQTLLDRYEQLWTARIERLDALLSEPKHPVAKKER